jgi:hypothetical protein
MPSNPSFFRLLLRAESIAAMPTTEEEVDKLFNKYHICSDHDASQTKSKKNSKPTPARLELAAAVLWFHTHVNEPEPALTNLQFEMQELLGECFVQDFAYFKGENHNKPSKLAHFLEWAAHTDSTSQRRWPQAKLPAQAHQANPQGLVRNVSILQL